MDRGAGHQLEDVRACSHGPWVRAIEGIFKEEKFHRTMNIFGRPGSPKNALYRKLGLKLRDNDEVRQAFRHEVEGLAASVGLTLPPWKPTWSELRDEAHIPG